MSELQIDFAQQIYEFLLAMVPGVGLAVLYDLIKAVRLTFRFKTARVFVLDVAFFLVAAFVTYCFMLGWSKGEFRFYVVLGEGIGFAVYRILLSRFVLGALVPVLRWMRQMSGRLYRLAQRWLQKARIVAQKMLDTIKKHLKNTAVSLYNLRKGNKRKRRDQNEQTDGEHHP